MLRAKGKGQKQGPKIKSKNKKSQSTIIFEHIKLSPSLSPVIFPFSPPLANNVNYAINNYFYPLLFTLSSFFALCPLPFAPARTLN